MNVFGSFTNEYDHFIGIYAFAATPYWAEFEIIVDGGEIILQSPQKDWQMPLTASEGALFAKEDGGDEFKLTFDPVRQRFIQSMQVQTSTHEGVKRLSQECLLVKCRPNPNDKLEKEYGVTASDLVKHVRQSENWIHQVKSFQVKAADTWIRTPQGIAHRKKELQAQFPNAEISSKRFTDIRPQLEGEIAIAFDDRRFRTSNYTKEGSMALRIWNGQELMAHEKYYTHEQEHYAFRKELSPTHDILLDMTWPRSQFHSFWWMKYQMENWQDFYGRAEEFILAGKQEYRGTPCYVLECYPKDYCRVRRWFVGIEDHLRYGDQTYETGQLTWEFWNSDYRVVRPAWWFPMTQGYHIFKRDENNQFFIELTRDITFADIRINDTLPDELFVIDFRDGVDVNDNRFGGFVTYKYKKDRTEEEWEELRQKARQRQDRDDTDKRALDERIGQAAMEFPGGCKWINTEPLTLDKLRGKVVILQFWGVWCGPCHDYMGMLRAPNEKENIVVIGIHTPEEDLSKIKADLDKYKADGAVCVDTGEGWGEINDWYRVKRRPYWVAIGPDGKVLGHADNPHQLLQLTHQAQ